MIEEIVVGGDIPVAPTLDSEREASPDFQTAFLVGKDGETVEVIYIGEIDAGRHLLVAPHQAWHRQSSKRKFTGLSKPLQLEVACCSVDAREEMLDQPMMKVWMGLVTDQVISALRVVMDKDARDALNYTFGVEGDPGFLPHVLALAHLAQEQFSFVSAESALEGERPDVAPLPTVGGSGQAGDSLQTRVSHLETSLNVIQATLDKLVERTAPTSERRVTFAPKPKIIPASPKSPTSLKSSTSQRSPTQTSKPSSSRYPSLDPGVVAAAISAGVEPQALEDMQKMMSSDLSGSRRLRESALRPSAAAPPQPGGAEVLSESEEEAEEDGLPSGASDTFQSSLDKLTEILSLLTLEKTRKAKASKVDQALDSISGGAHGEVSAGGGGLKRAAAARRALRQATRSSRGHQLPSGAFDAGRLDQHCATSRSSTYHPVGKGVDRAQESHWLLSHCSLLCVV